MEQLKKQKFILHDDLFEKLRLEYEKCEYCLIDEVRLYKYYGDYRLISEEYFQRKRNSEFIIGRIYTCNEIQSVAKAREIVAESFDVNEVWKARKR